MKLNVSNYSVIHSHRGSNLNKFREVGISFFNPPFFTILLIAVISMIGFGCSESLEECELNNTGIIRVTNSRPKGTAYVFFNEHRIIPSNADLRIKPGEALNIQLPAGQHQYTAYLRISSCNGGRCHVTTTDRVEGEVDLAFCETKNIIY